jgi:protein-S-isoprenylcysteine O-methyltransferase Ste14
VDSANQTPAGYRRVRAGFSKSGLSNAISNVCLAALFLVALVPGIHHYETTVADIVWAVGAALMGALSLVRVPPKSVTINAVVGVIFTQVARISLGRRFGLLPANRGIVESGAFRLVRHPIYSGWLILTIGYVIIYPSLANILVTVAVIPFMVWRIGQEETHLSDDASYRAYMQKVPYRILPYVL